MRRRLLVPATAAVLAVAGCGTAGSFRSTVDHDVSRVDAAVPASLTADCTAPGRQLRACSATVTDALLTLGEVRGEVGNADAASEQATLKTRILHDLDVLTSTLTSMQTALQADDGPTLTTLAPQAAAAVTDLDSARAELRR